MRLGGGDLAEEEAKAAYGESDPHQPEAGADPGQESSFGGEVDARILLDGLGWSRHGGIVRQGEEVADGLPLEILVGGIAECGFGGGLWSNCGDLPVLRVALFWGSFATRSRDNFPTWFAYIGEPCGDGIGDELRVV